MVHNICDITPFTLQDYPNHVACIIWFSGCNMLCSYCHNLEIVFEKHRTISIDTVLKFLKSRVNKLDGVVLCGGEPTMYKDLLPLCIEIKKLNFKIKLDTNGAKSDVLKEVLPFVDYVAVDFKAPKEKFQKITKSSFYDEFEKSVDLLLASNIEFEIRTTYHSELLSVDDLSIMTTILEGKNYNKTYYIQNCLPTENDKLPISKKFDIQQLNISSIKIEVR